MPGASTHFHRLLRQKVEEGIAKYAKHMADGGCENYPDYREAVGVVTGYRNILSLCEEIERSLDD